MHVTVPHKMLTRDSAHFLLMTYLEPKHLLATRLEMIRLQTLKSLINISEQDKLTLTTENKCEQHATRNKMDFVK